MKRRRDKTEKGIKKILQEETEFRGPVMALTKVLGAVLSNGVIWDHLLLALCNLAFAKYEKGETSRAKRAWYRRAVVLHRAMEKEKTRRLARKEAIDKMNADGAEEPEEEDLCKQ